MASEVDVADALQECAETWEPDVCVLGNVRARDVVAVCERLSKAEKDAETWRQLASELRVFESRISGAIADARDVPMGDLVEAVRQVVRDRDQARERESYALAAIERNDEVHADAIRAVRQRAERAEQTRDTHSDALAQAAREAGDAQDRIAALVVERDEARAHHDYAAWRVQYDAAVAATSRAEAAEARVRELEARLPVDGSHMPSIVDLLEDERDELKARVRELEAERDSAREAGRRVGREDVAKYANAIGRIEGLFGLAGPVSMRETVATVERELARLRAIADAAAAYLRITEEHFPFGIGEAGEALRAALAARGKETP